MPIADPVQCLQQLATIAGAKLELPIQLAPQKDLAYTWGGASVHPMQVLENAYQGIVRDAGRGVATEEERLEVEKEELGRFFLFEAARPQLISAMPGQGYQGDLYPFPQDRLRAARAQLRTATNALKAAGGVLRAVPDLQARLEAARSLAVDVVRLFRDAAGPMPAIDPIQDVPELKAAHDALLGVAEAIQALASDVEFIRIRDAINTSMRHLDKVIEGLASVQVFHVIEGFYLLRLLVRYRVVSPIEVTHDQANDASGEVTGLLNNNRAWLVTFLRDCLVDLDGALQQVDPSGNTLFFLKGGRALKEMLGKPDEGENDWDTTILINPNLPARQWYDLYLRVHNEVILRLEDYKRKFYQLLYANADDFAASLRPAPANPVADPADDVPDADDAQAEDDADEAAVIDQPPTLPYSVNCKAELIDVGIPRRETVEAREQWAALAGNILRAGDGVPFPGYLYYIDEYIMMIRDVLAGGADPKGKAPKRIARLYELLTLQAPGLAAVINTEETHIPPSLLPLSLAAAKRQPDTAAQRALIVLLRQLSQAYSLSVETGLAGAFDAFFSSNLPNAATLVVYPQSLRAAIQKAQAAGKWTPGYAALALAIGFVGWVSDNMENHLRKRAEFLALPANRLAVTQLVRYVYANGIFKQEEELEVQLAIARSFAAALQADYSRFPRPQALDPFDRASLQLYAFNPQADPRSVMELVQPIIEEYLQAQRPAPFTEVVAPGGAAIRLYWPEPVQIAPLTAYAPLTVSFTVAPTLDGWPLLSYVWGYPTLSLPDLIREYQRVAAETVEYGRRKSLRATIAALIEILTRHQDPEPANPNVAAIKRGAAHYLQLSCQQRSNWTAPDYPASYFPPPAFAAYQFTLLVNPAPISHELPLAPVPGLDRTMDLLVLNQGHGNWDQIANWRGADLGRYVVQPLVQSGVTASTLVIDCCLSSSLLPAMTPLTHDGARVISAVYSTTSVVVDTALWTNIQAALGNRDLNTVWNGLVASMRRLSLRGTGFVHRDQVANNWTEGQVAAYLVQYPNDRDPISIARYLRRIERALVAPHMTDAERQDALVAIAQLPTLGNGERAVLQPLAGMGTWAAKRAQIEQNLKQRLITLLTAPNYTIGMPLAAVQALPLFAPDPSLWSLFIGERDQLLALAAGLARCPTMFTVYYPSEQRLEIDAELLRQPLSPQVAAMLEHVFPGSAAEVPQMIQRLRDSGLIGAFDPKVNYLQP